MKEETELKVLDRFTTPEGLMFIVQDDHQYRVGQTIRYQGSLYTITRISISNSLKRIGLIVKKLIRGGTNRISFSVL